MKATTLIAAAALAFGTAAMAQTQDQTSRTENSAGADSAKPADDAQRTKNSLHRLGEKTRHAMHRAGDKMRHVAKNDKHDDRDADRHARLHRRDDTRAMGAAGRDRDRDHNRDLRDAEGARHDRIQQAYENWKARHTNG